MSGGCWDYENDSLRTDIFPYHYSDTDDIIMELNKDVILNNPFEDAVISNIVYDVFKLLHSYDWYASGDTSEETYRNEVEKFKKKWLKKSDSNISKEIVDTILSKSKEDIYKALNIKG